MIGKHLKGREFSRCLAYVLQKPGAQLLGGNVLSKTPQALNAELQVVARQSARTKRPLLHCSLSLAVGESLSSHDWRMLSQRYLASLGYRQNQYLLVRHWDTPTHEHVHLIVNRVSTSGKTVSDSWDYLRSQAIIHQLEAEYGLAHAPLSRKKGRSRLRVPELPKEQVLTALPEGVRQQLVREQRLRLLIRAALATARDLPSFRRQLEDQQVGVNLRQRQGEVVGISFDWEGERIAGSRLGQSYSWPQLLAGWRPLVLRPVDRETSEFEPEAVLPLYHQRYWVLAEQVQQCLGRRVVGVELDRQIAQIILQSETVAESRALVYSPTVQRVLRERGNDAAQVYLQAVMRSAQEALMNFEVWANGGPRGLGRVL